MKGFNHMKYQFNIKAFLQDLSKENMPDNLIISVMRSDLPYRLMDKIYTFEDNENCIWDLENHIIIWKAWCIPYKE